MIPSRGPAADKREPRDTIFSGIAVFGPIVAYLTLHLGFRISDIRALATGAALAAAATICQTIASGRPSGIAVLVMIELSVSIVLVLATHDPRVFLYKPVVLISVIGLYLLFTCICGRPTAYDAALSALTRRDPARGHAFERAYRVSSEVRSRLRVMTAAWGSALLLDAGVRLYFTLTASITEALIAPHVIDIGLIAAAIAIAALQFRAVKRLI